MVSTLLALTFLTVPDFDVFFETFSEKKGGHTGAGGAVYATHDSAG